MELRVVLAMKILIRGLSRRCAGIVKVQFERFGGEHRSRNFDRKLNCREINEAICNKREWWDVVELRVVLATKYFN